MDITTMGRDPFRIVDLFSDDALLEGRVDYLDDEDAALDPQKQKQLIELYEACHTLLFSGLPRDLNQTSPQELSFAIAAALPMELPWKQQILELRSEAGRGERLLAYLREWAPHLQKVESLRHRAGGNGHGLN